jgi:hypothetical protein
MKLSKKTQCIWKRVQGNLKLSTFLEKGDYHGKQLKGTWNLYKKKAKL